MRSPEERSALRGLGFLWFALLATLGIVLVTTPNAHADPYCGPGMYWDWEHRICQAFPVPPPVPIYTDPNHPDTNWGTR